MPSPPMPAWRCQPAAIAALAAWLAVACANSLQDAVPAHLGETTPREDQANLPAPRELAEASSSTLFCFCLVMPFGYEASLLAAQKKEGVGVFGCNDHLVFSNISGAELFGKQASGIHTAVVSGPLRVPRADDGNKAYLNTGTFIKVWRKLLEDGRFERYEWTLKVDVDTIVVPALLRGLLLIHCEPEDCRPMYLRDSSNGMNGPVEVVSRAAMKYFSQYADVCAKTLDSSGKNEAQFLALCLDSLTIPAEQEPNLLLQVDSADGRKPCDNMHAAFHPFKSWELSLTCLEQTGLRIFRKPPRIAHQASGPSLFCFACTLPSSYETMLVAQQFLAGVGIFSCDEYMVFSNVSSKELFRPGFRPSRWPGTGPKVSAVEGSMAVERGGAYFTPLNTGIFIKVWDRIFKDGLHRNSDWTLKFDPDAVFLPGRMRELLWSACPLGGCGSVFVENPGHYMRGPVEALSRSAVENFANGADTCRRSLEHPEEGENRYVTRCLRQLKVPSVALPELLSDADPATMMKPECSIRHAVYHPFKLWDHYMGCLAEAGYILPGPAGVRDRWTVAKHTAGPTMFCWALVMPRGEEPALLLRQLREGVGIFSCDAHLSISNASLKIAFGSAADRLKTAVIEAYLFTPRGGKYYTALNSPVFIQAWHAVFHDGQYRNYDWTLKLDADAVFVPDRVRTLLSDHCSGGREDCRAKYLTNFGGDVHGPVEALSGQAMDRYASGEMRCKDEVDYSDKGEDWYLALCMDLLDIPGEEEPRLLSDWHLDQGFPSACDTLHATFHPFKTWDYYSRCLCETGYDTVSCHLMMMPTTTTSTATSTFTTTTITSTTRTSVTSTSVTSTATTSTATTRTTLSSTRTTTTTTATTSDHHDAVIVFDGARGQARGGHIGGGPAGPPRGGLRGWSASSFRANGLPMELGCAGLLVAAGIAGLAALVSRNIRARRVEAVIAEPLPTSPSQVHERGTTRLAVGSEPPSQSEQLLRAGGHKAESPGHPSR